MEFEWDNNKRQENLGKHRIDFADADSFDWDGAIIYSDLRKDYGEDREVAFGDFLGMPAVLVYTVRENAVRLISWRRCDSKEVKKWPK